MRPRYVRNHEVVGQTASGSWMELAGRVVCMVKACEWAEAGESCPVPWYSLPPMLFSAQHASVIPRAL